MVGYEGNSFYNWLTQMVEITGGLWCFNNYNDLVYNPFNYYNARHYYYEMGDLMIDRMSGKQTGHDDFGVYLTPDNIASEIATAVQKPMRSASIIRRREPSLFVITMIFPTSQETAGT